jgi:hypothetical protein
MNFQQIWASITKDRMRTGLFAVIALASTPCVVFAQDARVGFPGDIAKEFARLTTTLRNESVGEKLTGLRLARWEHSPISWTILGNTASTMRGSVEMDFMVRFLSAQMTTKGRLKATYTKPTVVLPAGTVLAADDLPINKLAPASISFEIHFDANGLPRLTTKYVSSTFTVTTSADVTVLYGERMRLQELARQLPVQAMDPVPPSSGISLRCGAFVWSSGQNGIGSALVMIDDQLSGLERGACISESIGRALGIRGEADGRTASIFSGERDFKVGWTPFDSGVIAMLYDPQIRSGMDADAVTLAAQRLQAEYFRR